MTATHVLAALALPLLLTPTWAQEAEAPAEEEVDLRDAYDVETYRLDIRVDPEEQQVSGTTFVEATVVADRLDTFVLDLWAGNEKQSGLKADGVVLLEKAFDQTSSAEGEELEFTHAEHLVTFRLPETIQKGSKVRVAVHYSGKPGGRDNFTGFHWRETESGAPWIDTSCQGTGAHWWWPCKSNFFNADDKHERLYVNATVPEGLYAVSNGRLEHRVSLEEGWDTFRWFNP